MLKFLSSNQQSRWTDEIFSAAKFQGGNLNFLSCCSSSSDQYSKKPTSFNLIVVSSKESFCGGKEQGCCVWLQGLDRVQSQDSPGKVKVSRDPFNFMITRVKVYGIWNYAPFIPGGSHMCTVCHFYAKEKKLALCCLGDKFSRLCKNVSLCMIIQPEVIINLVGKMDFSSLNLYFLNS